MTNREYINQTSNENFTKFLIIRPKITLENFADFVAWLAKEYDGWWD